MTETKQHSLSELVTPEMSNYAGKLHGGNLLKLADKAAYVCATRYSGEYCVTASLDQVNFHEPVEIGELIVFHATVIGVGTTSMMIQIDVEAEDLTEKKTRKVASCYSTMVAMEDGTPVEVPPLSCDDREDLRNCLWAARQKELAEEHARKRSNEEERIRNLAEDEIRKELRQNGVNVEGDAVDE